jgi:hypothetical protein
MFLDTRSQLDLGIAGGDQALILDDQLHRYRIASGGTGFKCNGNTLTRSGLRRRFAVQVQAGRA